MLTWKSHLLGALQRLARSHAASQLAEVERIVCAACDADEVRFCDLRGRGLPAQTTLTELLAGPFEVAIRLQQRAPVDLTAGGNGAPHGDGATRFRPVGVTAEAGPPPMDPRHHRLFEEFVRLEQRNGFMWAGYIVRELLPRLGFAPEEAKHILDRYRSEGVFLVTKVPNPKNPEFPATGVRLNRDHPLVLSLLAENGAEVEREECEPVRGESCAPPAEASLPPQPTMP